MDIIANVFSHLDVFRHSYRIHLMARCLLPQAKDFASLGSHIMSYFLEFVSQLIKPMEPAIDWKPHGAGVLDMCLVEDVPVAGISGPWPDGSYSLTWWNNGVDCEMPRIEFHTSRERARRRFEEALLAQGKKSAADC
jgi:hypothetical protein